MKFKLLMHVMLQLGTITWSRADFTQSKPFNVRETIAEFVQDLCPLVDICDVNATSAKVKPNGYLGRGRFSCCQGCSCHPDCKEKDNCCYPDDYKSNNEPQPATTLTECLYTRLGQPEMINGLVTAYKTIVADPERGCVDTRPIRISSNVVLRPTCDDIDVTPLGPYYPVFSRDTGAVYKNVLCARCHGIRKTESFLPNLVCNQVKEDTMEDNSITDFLNFLNTKFLSPECHVDFTFTDVLALRDNRCFKDPIDTCTSETVSFPSSFNPPNLTFDVIQSLCESGLNSPTANVNDGAVYKNAFCSLCGHPKRNPVNLKCLESGHRTVFGWTHTFLLDNKMMHIINKAPGSKTRNQVCLTQKVTDEKAKQREVCKTIYCPTGKIRNEEGDCKVIGNYLDESKGYVNIKLTLTEKIDLDNESQEIFRERLVDSLKENKPWPANWEMDKIFHNLNSTDCHDNVIAAVTFKWEDGITSEIYDEIEHSIRLPWLFNWKEKTYHLTQSLFEYKLIWVSGTSPFHQPTWQHNQDTNPLNQTYFECWPMIWKGIFLNPNIHDVITVNKLFFCDQIQLVSGEFILGHDRPYLESNLTRRVLFDREFDIVEGKNGTSVRVCLHDTILADKSANEGSTLNTPAIVTVLISMKVITLLAKI